MQRFKRSIILTCVLPSLTLFLFACSSASPAFTSPQEAIENIQNLAGFPESTLSYIETTHMANSPNGDLQIDLYQDQEGRKYYVEPSTNTVVEIDARNLLDSPADAQPGPAYDQTELVRKANEFVRAAIPEFSSLQADLSYEMGNKGDNYFFDWRMPITQGSFMPPFIQVGITTHGDIFAFYNTVTLP